MIWINNQLVMPTQFPDKTQQVWKLQGFGNYIHIEWEYENDGEFMVLAQLVDLCRLQDPEIDLRMPYLPYGRQDKEVSNDATFGLHTFARLLNSLNFDSVYCVDPHSEVAGHLINNFHSIYPISAVQAVFDKVNADYVCYPDKGALHKYSEIINRPFVYGEKVRDQATGKITSYSLNADVKNKTVLIVDDICDGGATFLMLTEKLLEQDANHVYLYVSHGIFSKGTKILFDAGIERIFTYKQEIYR